ncbi:hypothetical protein PV326_002340 [Microctonus aethiopoides]|nr:hypothetical protein PV326_002340 [Microctonus aethiopoides]
MIKYELLFIAMCAAVRVFAYPTSLVTSGASVREPRAAYPEPYHHNYHHPHRVFENFQHYDSVHCQPHYGHFDCHVDHYDIYGGHGGHSGQGGYGGYGPHHYQGQNPGRVIRSANPDPHHRIHSFSRDDYYGSRAYGSYDGYNRGGNYNGRLYPGQESYRYNGGLNPSSAAFAGAITSSGGSYAHAYTNAGSGDFKLEKKSPLEAISSSNSLCKYLSRKPFSDVTLF